MLQNKAYKIAIIATVSCFTSVSIANEADFSSNLVTGQYQKCMVTALKPYMSMLKNNILWADRTLEELGEQSTSTPTPEPMLDLNTSQDKYIKSIKGMKVSTDTSAKNSNSNDGYTSYYYEIKFEDTTKSASGNPCLVLANHSVTLYPHYLNWSKDNAKWQNRGRLLNGPAIFYMNTDVPGFALQGENNSGYGKKANNGVCMLDNASTALHNSFGIVATFNVGQKHNTGEETLDPNECFASVVSKKVLTS